MPPPTPWTPVALTIDRLHALGYLPDLGGRRLQLDGDVLTLRAYGFVDVFGIHEGQPGILGIRAVWAREMEAELERLQGEARIAAWRSAGGRAELWGWWGPDAQGLMHNRVVPLRVGFARPRGAA